MPRRLLAALLYVLVALTASAAAPASVPDKVVVLTFDDASASHHAVARPLLKRLGFGATFFITEGFTFRTNKRDYLTWEQIAELHRDGFEIGNHTRDHLSHDLRLPQPARDQPDETARPQDDRQLQEEQHRKIEG